MSTKKKKVTPLDARVTDDVMSACTEFELRVKDRVNDHFLVEREWGRCYSEKNVMGAATVLRALGYVVHIVPMLGCARLEISQPVNGRITASTPRRGAYLDAAVLDLQIQQRRESLAKAALDLTKEMTDLAKAAKKTGPFHLCTPIQYSATVINTIAGELAALSEIKRSMKP